MRPFWVDIGNELDAVSREVDLLSGSLELEQLQSQSGDAAWNWLVTQGLASGIEKIYTGCERVMEKIARRIDGAGMEHTDGWHGALLRRMANPYPEKRAAVLTDECHKALDRLRAFRHRERNTYGLELDRFIVIERAAEAVRAFRLFYRDVQSFARSSNAG